MQPNLIRSWFANGICHENRLIIWCYEITWIFQSINFSLNIIQSFFPKKKRRIFLKKKFPTKNGISSIIEFHCRIHPTFFYWWRYVESTNYQMVNSAWKLLWISIHFNWKYFVDSWQLFWLGKKTRQRIDSNCYVNTTKIILVNSDGKKRNMNQR